MLSRLLSVLLLFTALLGGCAHHPVTTVESSAQGDNIFKTGVLWRISQPGLQDSYLLGTVHSEDRQVLAIGEAVIPRLLAADLLAVEVLMDNANAAQATRSMFFTDGSNLRAVAGEKLFQQSVAALQSRGIGEQQVLMMKPWAVFTVLSMPEVKTGLFLDAMLYQRAARAGKQLVGLETMQEQIAVFDELSLPEQVVLLQDTLKNGPNLEQMVEEIIAHYLRQDLQAIERANEDYMDFTDPALAARVNERLLYHRNEVMFQRMQPLLQQGNTFIAVGVLHLVGDRGLLAMLQRQGYQLQAVN